MNMHRSARRRERRQLDQELRFLRMEANASKRTELRPMIAEAPNTCRVSTCAIWRVLAALHVAIHSAIVVSTSRAHSTQRLLRLVVVLWLAASAKPALACWATWAWDKWPNTFATKSDLDACVAEGRGRYDRGTFYINDLHKQAGYEAVYVPGWAAPGNEILGTVARASVRSYFVLIDVRRPGKETIQYRERTVQVPVDRVVERFVDRPAPPLPLPALTSEPSPDRLWNGERPYSLISDSVMTDLRGTGIVVSKGTGDDEILSIPCDVDPEEHRRIAHYRRAGPFFSAPYESLTSLWVLDAITVPPTIEVRDREVAVPVDRPYPEPNPVRTFLEGNLGKVVILTLLVLAFLLVVVPYVHYQLRLRRTLLTRMFR